MVKNLYVHNDIFDEFFRYVKLCKLTKVPITVCNYTAEKLFNEYKLSPLGA
ncbi:hypothetical protein CLROS_024210 [Clostridium felsineum]|uniref:Uncharacterized protein n=1 Tax=Clostridium felsineum TaxID=36839 RepID=A0A1S8L7E2_9CLOT|nr:hypothetical protein CLROS_024210 [Clostridium felsineum]URZ12118.1 hypothetical protein CROST_028350 [Clostridium felsineum]